VEPANAPWRIFEPPPDPDVAPESAQPGGAGTSKPAVSSMAVAAGIGAVVLAIAAFLIASQPAPFVDVTGVDTETRAPDTGGLSAADGVVVEVSGAVARPGLYALPAGARVADAIEAAGGFGPRVDAAGAEQTLNLAATIVDGSKIRVPSRDDAAATALVGGGAGGGTAGGLVNVNTASASELDTLPGVGPATAAKIIAAREEQRFASVEDLKARKVVGTATFEKLRNLVTVGP
jgi:competence protein ComEA